MSKKSFFTGPAMTVTECAGLLGVAPDLLQIWVRAMGDADAALYPDDVARFRLMVQQMREAGYVVISRSALEDMEQKYEEMRTRNLDTLLQIRTYLTGLNEVIN